MPETPEHLTQLKITHTDLGVYVRFPGYGGGGVTIIFQMLGLYKIHRDVPMPTGAMLHACYLELRKQD